MNRCSAPTMCRASSRARLADGVGPVVALVERDRLDDALRHRLLGLEGADRVVAEERAPVRVARGMTELYTRIMRYARVDGRAATTPACASTSIWPRPDRAGSRPKAAAALERGKVFVNDREMTLADAAARVADRRRRPAVDGSSGQREAPVVARRRPRPADRLRRRRADRAEQAGRTARGAAAAAAPQRRALGVRGSQDLPAPARPPPPVRRPPDRSRHVGARAVREDASGRSSR